MRIPHFLLGWNVALPILASCFFPKGNAWWLPSTRITPRQRPFGQIQSNSQTRLCDASETSVTESSHHDKLDPVANMTTTATIMDSPVLRQVYPKLLEHVQEYGNPNIPLGSSEGRQCETLRRLHIQNKLTDKDVQLLTDVGFRWHDLEDVYKVADFDDLFQRLVAYRDAHDGDVSPPKKYAPDAELGAWVTGIRRLGPDGVDPSHRHRLDQIGFAWISQRKCGSAFMKQYRAMVAFMETSTNKEASRKEIWADDTNRKWIKAQQLAFQRGDLSETRKHYLDQLLGDDWLQRNLDD